MSVTKGVKVYRKLCDAVHYATNARHAGFFVVFRTTGNLEYVVEVS